PPLTVRPMPLKPVTEVLNLTVKLIGDAFVGSACPAAWLIATVGWVSMVSVKLWFAVPTEFVAVNVIGYVPAVPAAGVPESTPVVALNVTPLGRPPVSLSVGVGFPVAVTVNDPDAPTTNFTALVLVTAGAVDARK